MGNSGAMVQLGPHTQLGSDRCLAIVSPGNLFRLEWLKEHVRLLFPRLDCVAPRDLQHLQDVVKRSAETHRVLLTVGGDGTLNRVINAAKLNEQVIGLLPLGTGNDLARTLKIPHSPMSALHWLAQAAPAPTDLVEINGVLSHNSAGFGLDTQTLRVRDSSRGLAHSNYNVAFLQALHRLRPLELKLRWDGGERSGAFQWVLGMNAETIGKGTRVAPGAKVDDGLLEMVLFDRMPAWRMLAYLPRVIAGTHAGLPGITTARSRFIHCAAATPVDYAAADGELYYLCAKEVRLDCRAAAMTMLRQAN